MSTLETRKGRELTASREHSQSYPYGNHNAILVFWALSIASLTSALEWPGSIRHKQSCPLEAT